MLFRHVLKHSSAVLEVDLNRSIPPAHLDSQIRSYALQSSSAVYKYIPTVTIQQMLQAPFSRATSATPNNYRIRRSLDRLLLDLLKAGKYISESGNP